MILQEDSQLYRGIFWIDDVDNISNSDLYFQIPCDSNGNKEADIDFRKASLNGDNLNHKNTWDNIDRKYRKNKPFNYYPRGRIEISHGKATIYANPNICNDELKKWCIEKFNLTTYNGIKEVKVIPDFSSHYKCYLDD